MRGWGPCATRAAPTATSPRIVALPSFIRQHIPIISLPTPTGLPPRLSRSGITMPHPVCSFQHPRVTRRTALQAGSIGLLGLGLNHLPLLRAATPAKPQAAKSDIYIFLSGGLSQIDSFDPKPDAPAEIRGEFQPIATRTAGLRIVEHLPLLAQRSHLWSVVRSMTHRSNDHSASHQIMLSGRTDLPPGFNPSAPRPSDWP